MAFCNESDEHFPRQHRLNLSAYAVDVLESDKFAFAQNGEKINDQTIWNEIIHNYYEDADASIEHKLVQYEDELYDLLGAFKNVDDICGVLKSQKEKELKKKATQYSKEKTKSCQFYLSSDNYEYFVKGEENDDDDFLCEENYHYKSLSQYIKSMIEEYVRLPYVKREEIYFKPRFQLIKQAIENEVQLKITASNGIVYFAYPYQISTDPLSTANYLVCYSRSAVEKDGELTPATFRISAIKNIKKTQKHAFLSKDQKNNLEHALKNRGVQFMFRQEAEIHVKLTDAGFQKYRRQLHLRPSIAKRLENNEFVFNCTQDQAEFYFFKFGKDAEILSPPELRKKFAGLYSEAANLYTD